MKKPVVPILLAGFCGGLAEIAWIVFYGWVTQTSGAEIARQVVASLIPSAAVSPAAPA